MGGVLYTCRISNYENLRECRTFLPDFNLNTEAQPPLFSLVIQVFKELFGVAISIPPNLYQIHNVHLNLFKSSKCSQLFQFYLIFISLKIINSKSKERSGVFGLNFSSVKVESWPTIMFFNGFIVWMKFPNYFPNLLTNKKPSYYLEVIT